MSKTLARILVVDDDPSIRRLVSAVLKRAGYEVDMASGGGIALEMIGVKPYDVIVLDLMMPFVSGFEVLQRLATSQAPYVVVMSAASDSVIATAVNRHVFTTLRKPFEIADMLNAVRACLLPAVVLCA